MVKIVLEFLSKIIILRKKSYKKKISIFEF